MYHIYHTVNVFAWGTGLCTFLIREKRTFCARFFCVFMILASKACGMIENETSCNCSHKLCKWGITQIGKRDRMSALISYLYPGERPEITSPAIPATVSCASERIAPSTPYAYPVRPDETAMTGAFTAVTALPMRRGASLSACKSHVAPTMAAADAAGVALCCGSVLCSRQGPW